MLEKKDGDLSSIISCIFFTNFELLADVVQLTSTLENAHMIEEGPFPQAACRLEEGDRERN